MAAEKVLVLNATGKVGRYVCRALIEAGFEVYGTTRSSNRPLASQGVKPWCATTRSVRIWTEP
jgi:uncharacterized protein YbjT (DUF2867 family)